MNIQFFNQGRAAYEHNPLCCINPYHTGKAEYYEWYRGWDAARRNANYARLTCVS